MSARAADVDGDLLPDEWETQYGLSTSSSNPQWVGFWPFRNGSRLDFAEHGLDLPSNAAVGWADFVGHALSIGHYTVPANPLNIPNLNVASGFRLSFRLGWPYDQGFPDRVASISNHYPLATWTGSGGESWRVQISSEGRAELVFSNAQGVETLQGPAYPDLRGTWSSYQIDASFDPVSRIARLSVDGNAVTGPVSNLWTIGAPQSFEFGNTVEIDYAWITDVRLMGSASLAVPDTFADADGDGLNNWLEFQLTTNPTSTESDGDGMPDAWEVQHGFNPADPADANGDQDGDGLINWGEFTMGTNPHNSDSDSDGISDADKDSDGDGIPDGWECRHRVDALNANSGSDPDADGLSNHREYTLASDPGDADTDNDRIPDGWEWFNGMSPLNAADAAKDYDGDKLVNLKEYQNGSSPWPAYTVSDLGLVGWMNENEPTVFDPGWVAGPNNAGVCVLHHQSTLDGTCVATIAGVGSLGHLGGNMTFMGKVNNQGVAVGSSKMANGKYRACIWDATLGIRALELPANAATGSHSSAESHAMGINDNGVAIGRYRDTSGVQRYFVWESGAAAELASSNPVLSHLGAINNQNVVAAVSKPAGGNPARLFTATVSVANGLSGITLFPQSYWDWLSVSAISESNAILASRTTSHGPSQGLVIESSGDQSIPSLDPPLFGSSPTGFGGSGFVAGHSSSLGPRNYPFLYKDGAAVDLRNLVDRPDLDYVAGINASGQIAVHANTYDSIWDGEQYVDTVSSTRALLLTEIGRDADGDGLSDDWEDFYAFDKNNPADADPTLDADGDGVTNVLEFQTGTDPRDFYNGVAPYLEIIGGDAQVAYSGAFAAAPLQVRVRLNGFLVENAPITFSTANVAAGFALAAGGGITTPITVRTNASGSVSVYCQAGSLTGPLVAVASATGATEEKSVTFHLVNAGVALPPVTFDPPGGAFATGQDVRLSHSDPNVRLYFTLDGTEPTADSNWAMSGDDVWIEDTALLRARAIPAGGYGGALSSALYEITGDIGAGYGHQVFLRSDGYVFAWGYNSGGQLGNGTFQEALTGGPVISDEFSSPFPLRGVTAISCGQEHTIALRYDGTLRVWGFNDDGQLGMGDTNSRLIATTLPGLTNVRAVAAGWYHSLALRADGTVFAWGYDDGIGVLGNGDRGSSSAPLQVRFLDGVNPEPKITQIFAGSYQSFAIDENGQVWAWGPNFYGELGDGTLDTRFTPVKVPALAGAKRIAGGDGFSFMIREENGASVTYAWGYNGDGNLGLGTSGADVPVPTQVPALSAAKLVKGGYSHVVAVNGSDVLQGAGANQVHQVSSSATHPILTLSPITLPSRPVAISAGYNQTVVLTEDGKIWTVGEFSGFASGGAPGTVTNAQPAALPNVSAINNNDSDQDGLPDWQENELGTNRKKADSDGDGISDKWELDHNLNPKTPNSATADADLDGLSDRDEFKYGADPHDTDSDNDGVGDAADGWPANPVVAPPRIKETRYVAIDVSSTRIYGINNSPDGLIYYPVDRNPFIPVTFPSLYPDPDTLFMPRCFNDSDLLAGSFIRGDDGVFSGAGGLLWPSHGYVTGGQEIVIWGDVVEFAGASEASVVRAINNAGQLVVHARDFNAAGAPHLAFINGQAITDLGEYGTFFVDSLYGPATLNEQGTVVFGNKLWRAGTFETLPFTGAHLTDQAPDGTEIVIGNASNSAWIRRNAQTERLPQSAASVMAHAINNRVQIVGSIPSFTHADRPLLWQNGILTDVQSATDMTEWSFLEMSNINDRGMLFGVGYKKTGSSVVPTLLLPAEAAPEVLRVNSDFDEGRIDSSTGFAIPDCDDAEIALEAERIHLDGRFNQYQRITEDLHPGWFGVNPHLLPDDFWDGATVTIRKVNQTDSATGRPESGHVRFYAKWGNDAFQYCAIVPYDPVTLTPVNLVQGGINKKPGEGVYGSTSAIPETAQFYMEGVRPGKITLEWRLQKGGLDVKFQQTFLVATQQSVADWKQEVRYQIRLQTAVASGTAVDISTYHPGNGFLANYKNVLAIYYYYQQLFREMPERFMWAGMAKVAAAPIYAAMSDLTQWWHLSEFSTGFQGRDFGVEIVIDALLLSGQKNIFNDMAWAHRAYRASGLPALTFVEEKEGANQGDFAAWRALDTGIAQGNFPAMNAANGLLLLREQDIVVQPNYDNVSDTWMRQPPLQTWVGGVAVPVNPSGLGNAGEWLSANSLKNPMPGGPAFRATVPGGRIDVFKDRWKWISNPTNGMLEIWTGTSTGGPNFNHVKRMDLNNLQMRLAAGYRWPFYCIDSVQLPVEN